jgi:hypothetical protein
MSIGFRRRVGGGGRLEVNKSTVEKRELFPIYSIPSMHHRLTNYRKQRKLEEVIVVAFHGLKMS